MLDPNFEYDLHHAPSNAPRVAVVLLIAIWLCIGFGVYKCSSTHNTESRMNELGPEAKSLVAPQGSG